MFRIRRTLKFFHSPTTSLVLIKVVYNITYGENTTMANAKEEIPHCSSPVVGSTEPTIDFNQTNITYGWTSCGVYTMFHPTVLSMMQGHSPFALLRIFHMTLNQRSPEADTFLWDGSYELPTLHLNLHITSLACVPTRELFASVLMDLNKLVRVYSSYVFSSYNVYVIKSRNINCFTKSLFSWQPQALAYIPLHYLP